MTTLQEVGAAAPALARLSGDWNVHICPYEPVGRPAVLTRLPVLEQGCLEGGAWSRVEAPGGPVTIVSLHLRWPWPFEQPDQVARLLGALRALPRPVVVAGDFNQTPWSASVARIAAATDTNLAPSIKPTHIFAGGLARLTIDHILIPQDWFATIRHSGLHGSDHIALAVQIARAKGSE